MSKTEPTRKPAAGGARLPSEMELVVQAARDKKAVDLVVLDLRKAHGFTDYFVICSGQNARQIKAIADAVLEALRHVNVRPAHVEGYDHAEWVLIDYFDFIVHIFAPQTRRFYGLQRLWGTADVMVTDERTSADAEPRA